MQCDIMWKSDAINILITSVAISYKNTDIWCYQCCEWTDRFYEWKIEYYECSDEWTDECCE